MRPIVGDEGVGHAQGHHQSDGLFVASGIIVALDKGGEQMLHRGAAGMQVEDDVMAREQFALQKMRKAARRRSIGRPGKARLRLPPSRGEQRRAAITAGVFAIGRIVTLPLIDCRSRRRMSFARQISPSYSSPWFPAISSTDGPSPLRRRQMGTLT